MKALISELVEHYFGGQSQLFWMTAIGLLAVVFLATSWFLYRRGKWRGMEGDALDESWELYFFGSSVTLSVVFVILLVLWMAD